MIQIVAALLHDSIVMVVDYLQLLSYSTYPITRCNTRSGSIMCMCDQRRRFEQQHAWQQYVCSNKLVQTLSPLQSIWHSFIQSIGVTRISFLPSFLLAMCRPHRTIAAVIVVVYILLLIDTSTGIVCYSCTSSTGCTDGGSSTCALGLFGCVKIATYSGGLDQCECLTHPPTRWLIDCCRVSI
jgi:hypothetical protein